MSSIALEEYELMKDSNYRLYVSTVDKALKYFDNLKDWHDFISALNKLNKVLQEYQRFPVIPRRITISKRLAQCMHFSLPQGVHLKALETYDIIFKCMGTNRLSHELFIYSAGLFPLFGNSAIDVKPALLTVYETHFVPLGQRLRPALSGFLSGILLGSEEVSDHFERTNSLLEKVCEGVGFTFFYGCLWGCMACNSAIRLPAVFFVLSHFNKKLPLEDQMYIMGTDVEIMVKALCAGVQDNNNLVQRSSLDLLLAGFPLHNNHLSKRDKISLVTAALTTIARRDSSLTRRLYAWILGSDVDVSLLSLDHPFVKKIEEFSSVQHDSLYFDMYSKELVIEGVKEVLGAKNIDICPYRLLALLSLEVRRVILDDILFEVFRALYLSCNADRPDGIQSKQEILKSANSFFSSFESWDIWQYIGSLYEQACKLNIEELTTISEIELTSTIVKSVGQGPPNIWEVCELCEFLLSTILLEACSATPSEHLLNFVIHIVSQLTQYIHTLSHEQTARTLKLCTIILSKILPLENSRKISKAESTSNESSIKHPEGEFIKASLIRSRAGSELSSSVGSGRLPFHEIESENELHSAESINDHENCEENNITTIFKVFLKKYENFYVTLVGSGRIIESILVPEAFEKLRKRVDYRNENEKEYANELRRILTAVMNNDDEAGVFYRKKVAQKDDMIIDIGIEGNGKWESSFQIASKLLVDISSFPSYCVGFDYNHNHNHNVDENVLFSPWIKILVVCSCCLESSPKLQLIAIQTLLDLLFLSKTSAKGEKKITGLLSAKQAHFLENNMTTIKVIAETLWRNLGSVTPDLQVTCIELIYKLHAFSSNDTVERVLGEALLTGNEGGRVEALHRFAKLWHVGRELSTKGFGHVKLLHTCLLKLLDNLLSEENSPLKIETQTWLIHSLMRGDITRLLDPILLMLLDPATARMGILHVNVQHSSACANNKGSTIREDDAYNKIYAISSVDGNVIYHVSNSTAEKGSIPKRLKWRWKKESSVPANHNERVYAVTSLKTHGDNRPSYVTEKNMIRNIELPRTFTGNISLFVNPFVRGLPEDESCNEDDFRSENEYNLPEMTKNARRFNITTKELDLRTPKNIEMDLLPSQPRITLEVTTSDSPPVEVKFFNKLKSRLIEPQMDDCEESHSADEYFNSLLTDPDVTAARQVLDYLIDKVVKNLESQKPETNVNKQSHPFHSHLLLYCGVYDSSRTLYAFNTLKNVLLTNSRLFLCCAATSGIMNTPLSSDLLILLARHRKSIFGRSFHGDVSSLKEYKPAYERKMYLEILVSICLNFARSYYPNLGLIRLTPEEIAGNRQVQLTSIEILGYLCTELIPIVRETVKGFANYIADMLMTCKVQKVILHCILSNINRIQDQQQQMYPPESKTFTEEIIEFNDPRAVGNTNESVTDHSEALQIQLLRVLLSLIMLEEQVERQKCDTSELTKENPPAGLGSESEYIPGRLIPQQKMFHKAVMTALKLKGRMRALHYNWTCLITAALPYLGPALLQVVMITIHQLCCNLEELAVVYSNKKSVNEEYFPPDYAIMQLEALTLLCHYCVLDSTQQISPQPLASGNGNNLSNVTGSNPTQILNNLVHVFTPIPLTQDATKEKNQQVEILAEARRSVLGTMPRIISSVTALWHAVTDCKAEVCVWGNPKLVKDQILEFLSPISRHHGATFLAAIAVAWQERKDDDGVKKVLPIPSRNQQVLVNLVSSIKVMPIDTWVQTVRVVVKQPPHIHGSFQDVSLDVSVLELFYVYMQSSTSVQLGESWNSLLGLLRDGLVLPPPALFLVLAILNEFVLKTTQFKDKKDQRDLQDITAKLVEACGNVAGACLEQTTWLRRNLTVKEDLEASDDETTQDTASPLQQHSVHAQLILAQILAQLLDVSYGSQEKEKVASLLTNLMYNITPYLRNHQPKNAGSFLACSQLLADLSAYPYTRKAWKRDIFELVMEPSLFQMDMECLSYWITIIDNLMTHDNATFGDLMNKISYAPSGSYSIFSSREQEYEQHSQNLKRLAFVIFCSETNQYHKSMPTIQSQLKESLRLPEVSPSVQAQVFLCFRVLLLRMLPDRVTMLWPLIFSEMVQVFMRIELELITDSEEFSSHIKLLSGLDSSWVVNSSNGLDAHGHPHWLQLTLAAAKLLDLAVVLPAQELPQFQMYRWAFVNEPSSPNNQGGGDDASNNHDFVSHVSRISRLMDTKYGKLKTPLTKKEGQLLIDFSHLDSLQQLHPFFSSLGLKSSQASTTVDMKAIEQSILNDFLEKMPNRNSH